MLGVYCCTPQNLGIKPASVAQDLGIRICLWGVRLARETHLEGPQAGSGPVLSVEVAGVQVFTEVGLGTQLLVSG